MHETTQRRVCRTAFVVGCVLPTLCAVLWIAYLQRPWRQADWQRTLGQRLHVRAAIGEVRSPRPGVTQLVDVCFADLRSEQPLGTIDELRIEGPRAEPTLVADRIEIFAAQIPAFAAAVATWLSSEDSPALQLRAKVLVLVGSQGKFVELVDLRWQSRANNNIHKRIELEAHLSSVGQGGPSSAIQLVVEHHPGQHAPLLVATLKNQHQPLPAWLFAELAPGMKRCSSAQFSGSLQIESLAREISGRLNGQLEEIDLGPWIDPAGPHRLQGTATLHLENLHWRDGRIEVAQGQLRAGAGAVSRSLLAELTKRLFCVPGEGLAVDENNSAGELLSFDELACGFRINSAGITISGVCHTDESDVSGCLLAVDDRPLLIQPGYTDLPVAQLVQVLMQPAASWLPATREANAMAEGLPLPTASPRREKKM